MTLIEVDSLQVQVIVDNVTDSLSSVPDNVVHEMDYLADNGMKELSGECLCCGAHGLSLLLTASKNSLSHSLLSTNLFSITSVHNFQLWLVNKE